MDKTLLIKAVEALLFISGEPIAFDRLLTMFEGDGVERSDLKQALGDLKRNYLGRGVEVIEVGGGYQMRTNPDMAHILIRLETPRPVKLSQAALETMAIVAYRQPTTRAEVEEVRGVDCGAMLRSLQERGLVKVVGKKDLPGRPLLYGTTREFLELFGLSSLTDLPTMRQIEEMTGGEEEEVEVEEVEAEVHGGETTPGGLLKQMEESQREDRDGQESEETPAEMAVRVEEEDEEVLGKVSEALAEVNQTLKEVKEGMEEVKEDVIEETGETVEKVEEEVKEEVKEEVGEDGD